MTETLTTFLMLLLANYTHGQLKSRTQYRCCNGDRYLVCPKVVDRRGQCAYARLLPGEFGVTPRTRHLVYLVYGSRPET